MGIVTCPVCSSGNVQKALMAPAVSTRSNKNAVSTNIVETKKDEPEKSVGDKVAVSAGHPQQTELRAAIKSLRDKVTSEADYVGDKFASEARKIHDQEIEPRGIYGEATREEVSGLIEDGIEFLPLPTLPEEHN